MALTTHKTKKKQIGRPNFQPKSSCLYSHFRHLNASERIPFNRMFMSSEDVFLKIRSDCPLKISDLMGFFHRKR